MDLHKVNEVLGNAVDELSEKKDPLAGLPADASKWNKSQQKKVVNWLAGLSTRELRKRQDIVKKQQRQHYEKVAKSPGGFKSVSKSDERTTASLDMMDRALAAAVDKREFGPEPKKTKKRKSTKKKGKKSSKSKIVKELDKEKGTKNPQALAGYIKHYVKTGKRKPGQKI